MINLIPILHCSLGSEVFGPDPLLRGRTVTLVHIDLLAGVGQLKAVHSRGVLHDVCLRVHMGGVTVSLSANFFSCL